MKKYFPFLLSLILGFIFGNMLFKSYETETVMASNSNLYILQYGAYTDKIVLNDILENLNKDEYIVLFENGVYYVYFAVTTDYNNAKFLQKYYGDQKVYLYIKNYYLGNSLLINDIKNLDNKFKEEKHKNVNIYAKATLGLFNKYAK